jgi:hypothetical protein
MKSCFEKRERKREGESVMFYCPPCTNVEGEEEEGYR